jgi:UDP-N-acetylglucosamine diphosphorylase / glucose-1-phosphate thymidylyltransferase / UDP-N-acetylgalactosamine diphosphorylase / glucosamine-1-phosphate N-acetyltransferase / galactosamine-1-phosphate N-acetyltransferase
MNSSNPNFCFSERRAFRSLSEAISPFAMEIAGEPLYRHLCARWQRSYEGQPKATIQDPLLLSDIAAMGEIQELFAVERCPTGGVGETAKEIFLPTEFSGTELPLVEPWQLLDVLASITGEMTGWVSPEAEIEADTQIEGNVRIEAGARILAGARIKGDVYIGRDVFIGNNVLVRGNTSLAAGCVVGYGAEIKSTLALEGASIGPGCAVPDAVLGKNCILGGAVRISNTHPRGESVRYKSGEALIDTKRMHFGAIIGDGAVLAGGVRVSPGRNVAPDAFVGPSVVVVRNVVARTRVELEQKLRVTSNPGPMDDKQQAQRDVRET